LAATIKQQLNMDAELIRDGGGVFDVRLGAELIYSKFETHEFPDELALIKQLKQALIPG